MNSVSLKTSQRFSQEKMQKVPLFESTKMFCDQYCLLPGQSQRIHSHEYEDKIYIVLEGEALITIGEEQDLVPEGNAVIAKAGTAHGVENASDSNVVLLVVMAPKPQKHS